MNIASLGRTLLASAALLTSMVLPVLAQDKQTLTADQAKEEHAYTIGVQAYIYGYPLVEMYRVRYKTVADPSTKEPTPLNHFRHLRKLADHTLTTVVMPNNDTLYSSAWLDLAKEPIVLDVPDSKGRYYVMQFMDFFTNSFAYVGKRTTGTGPESYAVVGPGWIGTLPEGLKRIQSPTKAVWLLGRTLVDGPDDLPAVHALQDQYLLTPLSLWRKKEKGKPSIPRLDFPAYDVSEPLKFFELLNVVLTENPPPDREQALMSLFGEIGIGSGKLMSLFGEIRMGNPGKPFQVATLDAATARGLRRAVDMGQRLIASLPSGRPVVNGWLAFAQHTGKFGDDYRYRAHVAKVGLASNDPEEAYNFSTRQDKDGRPLVGNRKYVVRFDKGQLPPVDAFWSLTMYRLPGIFLVENSLGRYALGDRSKELRYEDDGSLNIYIQRESPGKEMESNWLPAPAGDFILVLRCYLPRPAITNNSWKPPAVRTLE